MPPRRRGAPETKLNRKADSSETMPAVAQSEN
jgi:hypothetical protein